MYFFEYLNHFDDGKVTVGAAGHIPFEIMYRFISKIDPTFRQDRKLLVQEDQEVHSVEVSEPHPDTAYLIIHRLSKEDKDQVEAYITENGYAPASILNKYLEAMHQDAKVVWKENITHIYWFSYLSSEPSIFIKLAFSLRRLCPYLFEGDMVFSDEFKNALAFIDKDNWTKLQEYIDPYFEDLRREKWQRELKTMFANTYSKQIERVEADIESQYKYVEQYTSKIREIMKQIDDLQIKARGMKMCSDASDKYDEFVGYLNDIDANILSYNNGVITLQIRGFVDNYDPDAAANIIPTKNGYLYERVHGENVDDMMLVYKKTFIEEKYKLRVVSNFKLDQNQYSRQFVNPANGNVIYEKSGKAYLCNPHLNHHNCFGNNSVDIVQAMKDYDYYSVAMFLNAANSNISFYDGTVMREMSEDIIKHREAKIFFCPEDGNDYSMDDILIKEKGEANGTETDAAAAG